MDRIVVIGASQGGVQALCTLVRGLPADFPAPILIVVHVGAGPSVLPSILNDVGRLEVRHARNGIRLRPGCVIVAPPDHHLLVVDGAAELSRGPRENWARPAIDPLFRSAAETYGPAAIGVVLTGRLNDGTSGLYEIKRRGGLAVVQEPQEAEAPSMPQSALDNVPVDYRLPLSEIAALLVRLTGPRSGMETPSQHGARAMPDQDLPLSRPIAQTCPECGGAMREERQGTLSLFRCHIGHIMTAEVMAAVQLEILEKNLAVVLRTLNERVDLCRRMAEQHAGRGDSAGRDAWTRAAEEAHRREQAVRDLAQAEWAHVETAEEESADI